MLDDLINQTKYLTLRDIYYIYFNDFDMQIVLFELVSSARQFYLSK